MQDSQARDFRGSPSGDRDAGPGAAWDRPTPACASSVYGRWSRFGQLLWPPRRDNDSWESISSPRVQRCRTTPGCGHWSDHPWFEPMKKKEKHWSFSTPKPNWLATNREKKNREEKTTRTSNICHHRLTVRWSRSSFGFTAELSMAAPRSCTQAALTDPAWKTKQDKANIATRNDTTIRNLTKQYLIYLMNRKKFEEKNLT